MASLLDLELTIISAKHLKNVNWRNGDLKPYVVFHLDNSDHRLATHSDDSGSTRPVWNERFTLPITRPIQDSVLSLEIFHSKTFDAPKPLVGSLKFPLSQLADDSDDSNSVRNLELIRPSGRPQGKIRVKLAVKERTPPPPPPQNYQNTPHMHYYSSAPPPSPYTYSDHYAPEYYYAPYYPPQPSRPLYSRASNYGLPSGPSAPVDLSSSSNDQKFPPPPPPRASTNYGLPSGPSAPVDYSSYHDYKPLKNSGTGLSGAMGGLNLEDGNSSYEKDKNSEREGYSYGDYHRRDY